MANTATNKPRTTAAPRRSPTGELERGGSVVPLQDLTNRVNDGQVMSVHSPDEDDRGAISSERTTGNGTKPPLLKLTLYRLLFVGLTAGLGSWKAVAASRNQAVTTNTLDWVIGIVLTLTWFMLGGLSKTPSASTTFAWFFHFDYTPCVVGSSLLAAEAALFTAKLLFYAVLLLDGCSAPVLFVIAKPVERRPGIKGFMIIFLSLVGVIYLSFASVLLMMKLSTSKWPLVGFKHDPFLTAHNVKVDDLRVPHGGRHMKVVKWFRIVVLIFSVIIALFCFWYSIFLAASYGTR